MQFEVIKHLKNPDMFKKECVHKGIHFCILCLWSICSYSMYMHVCSMRFVSSFLSHPSAERVHHRATNDQILCGWWTILSTAVKLAEQLYSSVCCGEMTVSVADTFVFYKICHRFFKLLCVTVGSVCQISNQQQSFFSVCLEMPIGERLEET